MHIRRNTVVCSSFTLDLATRSQPCRTKTLGGIFVSAPKCRDIVLASFDVDLGGACNMRMRLLGCMYIASLLFIDIILLPRFHPFIMAITPRQQSYTDISTSVRDCVRQRNETPTQREERLDTESNEKRLNSI